METTEQQDVQAETLSGDIRDSFLTLARDLNAPFAKLPEGAQRAFNDRVDRMAEDLVRRAVFIALDRGFVHIPVTTGKAVLADGIKIEVSASRIAKNCTILGENPPGPAVLVFADVDDFLGERAPAPVDKDQPGLDVDQDQDRTGPLQDTSFEATTIEMSERIVGNAAPGVLKGCTIRLDHFEPGERRDALKTLALSKGASVILDGGEVEEPTKPKRRGGKRSTEERVAARAASLTGEMADEAMGATNDLPETEMPVEPAPELEDA